MYSRFISAIFLTITLWAGAAQCGIFNPTTFTLKNGMQVVVIENPRVPAVTHMLWWKVGAIDEQDHSRGLAHFFEHLMFRGTNTIKPGEMHKIFGRNGVDYNAFTSNDFTAYYEIVAKDRLPMVMKIEADRMQNLLINDDNFHTEKNVVIEERRLRIDNNPKGLFWERLSAMQYLNHPARLPVIGWAHKIQALTKESAQAFYDKHYKPNNAILVLAGDITPARAKALAEEHYGAIPAGPISHIKHKEPRSVSHKTLEMRHKLVKHPSWMRLYNTPAVTSKQPVKMAALELLAHLLGNDQTSRLYQSLVVKKQLAISAGCSASTTARDFGTFYVSVTPKTEKDIPSIDAALEVEFDRMRNADISADELARAKKNLIADATFAQDDLKTAGMVFGEMLTVGGTIDDIEKWPEHIKAVTPDMIAKAAQETFTFNNGVTGILTPELTQGAQ